MMDRYKDFWQVTEDGLAYSARSLKLDLTAEKRERLMRAYLTLASFPDVQPGLEQLKAQGLRLAILSNGEPKMLQAAARHGIAGGPHVSSAEEAEAWADRGATFMAYSFDGGMLAGAARAAIASTQDLIGDRLL